MELIELITNDIKKAMLAKDKIRLEALRGIKKELLESLVQEATELLYIFSTARKNAGASKAISD